ncbi:hypothetical protein RM780_10020 [Streptomyces sp. DSM 44917]|uniref:Uncharacterized protein n=1 Tax=Streptomyces boetiae TaxID=3075541 RepID=A0ABU2L6V9_9ACTN|nr:hypothetical protein [Streptomyces sp. DSM 44917]MDT0307299.1 hypothetical protein [Streptomyces sp. DSM 44917]
MTEGMSGRSRVVVWLTAVVCGALTVGLAVLVVVANLDTAALAGGIVGTAASLFSTVVAVLALVRSSGSPVTARPPARAGGVGGELHNTISGGIQAGPVYQGRDFSFGTPPHEQAAPPRQPPTGAGSDGTPSAQS